MQSGRRRRCCATSNNNSTISLSLATFFFICGIKNFFYIKFVIPFRHIFFLTYDLLEIRYSEVFESSDYESELKIQKSKVTDQI